MASLLSFESPPADYPNHLSAPHPKRIQVRPAHWLVLLLLLACLVPRVVMALRIPSICIDGPIYVNSARALEAGNFRAALFEGSVNIYPFILASLHHLGLEWEMAAALWGVTISSLVVLPLWGWVRRQFDDRVALAACLLYVVHPKFILESPDVIRDPTFWFLFMLAIYWLWRAVTEVHYGFFMAAGAAIMLTLLTRIEGLFLFVPLVLWTFWRWRALRTARGKLLIGATLCVLAFPSLVVLAGGLWMHDQSAWTAIRLRPLARIQPWLASVFGSETAAGTKGVHSPISTGRMIRLFIPTMTRGLAPGYALLMFGGILGWRRIWARRDHQPLFYTAVVIMGAIWIQLWYDQNISRRYALPIVLMAAPFAALGLLAFLARLQQGVRWLGGRVRSQRAVASTALALILVGGVAHSMTSDLDMRRVAAQVGHWTRQEFSGSATLVGPAVLAEIISYYAEGCRYLTIPVEASNASMDELVTQNGADVVILWPSKRLSAEQCDSIAEHLKKAGLQPVAPDVLPNAPDNLHVLVRANRLESARTSPRRR